MWAGQHWSNEMKVSTTDTKEEGTVSRETLNEWQRKDSRDRKEQLEKQEKASKPESK
jgi:hypothetical protein